MHSDPLSVETFLCHDPEEFLPHNAVVPPIVQSSLFSFNTLEQFNRTLGQEPERPPYGYSRTANPTCDVLERKLAELEGAEAAKTFSCGMAAITAAILQCVRGGGHVVAVDTCYGPVRELLQNYLAKFSVSVTFVNGRCAETVLDAVRPETTLIYLESPSSLVFELQDLRRITAFAKGKGIATVIDNTYSTPLYQNPISMGVDMVVHSLTKYVSGHSDLTAGVVCGQMAHIKHLCHHELNLFGANLGAFQAWLVLRGMRTLGVRLKRHEASGNQVATWLQTRKEVQRVHHVGLEDYPQAELRCAQMRGTGGLLSFEPARGDYEWVRRFVEALKLFKLGVSWGGFESLVVALPYKNPAYDTPYIIRLFCGLEDPGDLIRDIEQAFLIASAE